MLKNKISTIYLLLLLFGCRSNNPKAWKIEKDPNANLDTVYLLQKSGITHNDTPIWYNSKLENLIIEEIAETLPYDQVSINGVTIDDYPKNPDYLPDNFVLTRRHDRTNYLGYLNLDDSVSIQFNSGELKFMTLEKYSNTNFQLEDLDVFQSGLDQYKEKYPESYSLRNLFGSYLLADYNKLDTVETIDITFLYLENARIDIHWLNKHPIHAEFWFFK
jgi:hypothetical protein